MSAYVNGIAIQLPLLPSFSWEQIYILFSAAAIMLVLLLVFGVYQVDRKRKSKVLDSSVNNLTNK